MKRIEILFGLLRLPLDGTAAFLALVLSYRLRLANVDLVPRLQLLEPATTLPPFAEYMQTFVVPGIVIFLILAALFRLYVLRITLSAWLEVGRLLTVSLLWLVTIMAWYFLLRRQLFYSRILLLHSTFFLFVLATVLRGMLTLVQRSLLRRGIGVRNVLSVGAYKVPSFLEQTLTHDPRYHYLGHLHSIPAAEEELARKHIDLILQTDPNPESSATRSLIDTCRSLHVGYAFLPPVLADVPHQLQVEHLGILPLMRFQPTPLDGWGRVVKFGADLVLSVLLSVLLLPVFIVIAVMILVDSGWPVFYVSRRVGEHGRGSIPLLKFRTMVLGADRQKPELAKQNHRDDGPLFKIKHDPRITRSGQWLRRWSLDELPQLWNVLAGHLALVGPRPHLPEEVQRYSPQERRVFAVRPGLTGLAQISGRSDLSFQDEVRLDLRYIEEWSPGLDLWILWRTPFVLLRKEGAD